MEQSHTVIPDLLNEISQDLGWGEANEWDNYDFDKLNKKIEEKTGVQLSTVTLKRVFGKVKYNSKPSTHTLNTLAQYVGFADFREYQTKDRPIERPASKKEIPQSSTKNSNTSLVKNLLIIGTVALLAILLWSGLTVDKSTTFKRDDFSFEHTKIGEGFPASVIYRYDATKATQNNKVEIQQNWDSSRRTVVNADDSIHNSLYHFPGYFEAKLVVDDQIIKEQKVFIPSNGWVTAIEREDVPMYVSSNISMGGDSVGIDPQYIISQSLNLLSEEIWTHTSHVQRHDVFSDDFTFKASLKSAAVGGVNTCQKIQTLILLEGAAMSIPISKSGCVADLNFFIPSIDYDAKTNDLSMFGTRTENWNDIMVVSKDGHLSIYLNGNELKKFKFEEEAQRIIGFRFRHQGSGWVKDISLNGVALI